MDLKVCFVNPNPNASSIVSFPRVLTWGTDHGELKIYQRNSDQPTVIFSNRQWIWAEETNSDDIRRAAKDRVPVRVDRNRPDEPYESYSQGESGRKSDLSDLSYPTPAAVERARAASVEFAIDGLTVPWSETHMRKLIEYEAAVRAEHGQAGVDSLPWNKVPRASDRDR